MTSTTTAYRTLNDGRIRQEMMRAIRPGDRMAVDGFRPSMLASDENGDAIAIRFVCGSGYRVDVLLAANDTYTVRRTFVRGGREWVKGEAEGVYAEQLSDVFYRAGMFRDDWTAGGIV